MIWIDEAGLVGIRDMAEIMRIAGNSTRVILTGDTAQHAPVARGDAFRLMQHYAGLRVAEVTQIRRQEREDYRKAVAALAKGDLRTAFRRLDEMGAILEVADDAERYRLLAHDFLSLSRKDSVPLVVSPTHAESAKVTDAIREAKREAGRLGPEKSFTRFHNLQWEEPDRRRAENYRAGLVVQFHQNVHGIQRGAVFRVTGHDEKGGVRATSLAGREIELPLGSAARFQVFEEREIAVARGDRIRITHNGKSADGRRLNNGNIFTVEGFSRDGKIILNTGAVLNAKHGHFNYGYCQTSHSSQSKSVRDVLVAQSADSFLASSAEQFYVSVSRGKESIRIYTDNRRELQGAVGNSSTRRAGIELAGISSKEAGALVSDAKDGRQWRDLIQSRRAEGAAKSHVQSLLRERKQDGLKKPANMDFRQYLEMRRNMAGPDGKIVRNVNQLLRVGMETGEVHPTKIPMQEIAKRRSPDSKHLVGIQNGQFYCYDVDSEETKTIQVGRGAINDYQWLGNDRCAAIAAMKDVVLYDRPKHTLTEVAALPSPCNRIGAPSPDGRFVFCIGRGNGVLVDLEKNTALPVAGGEGISWVSNNTFAFSREIADSALRGTWLQTVGQSERRVSPEPYLVGRAGGFILSLPSGGMIVFATKNGLSKMKPDGTDSPEFVKLNRPPGRALAIEEWKAP